jgi:hypothetical protein
MSRKKSYRAPDAASDKSASSSRGHRITYTIIIALIVTTLVAVFLVRRNNQDLVGHPTWEQRNEVIPDPDVTKNESAPAKESAGAEPKKPTPRPLEFASLKGRWQRPEENYEITIRDVAQDGTVKAAYFNGMNINVSQARATKEGEHIKLFVELRDVNYPGSTYRLNYLPETDEMVGVYYQAALGQEFQVVFQRRE